jgi:quinoprotein glucose dehydrogenase
MKARVAFMAGAALLASAAYAQTAQTTTESGDWPRYTRDLAGTRYSPLTQINTTNVGKLAPAWSFRVRPQGGGSIVSSATPIMVGDLLYLPIGNAVVALQPETGAEVWRHAVTDGAARRTVSYWPGDARHAPRIFYSNGKSITALDAKTGQVATGFGVAGALALDVPYNGPPTVYKDVLIVGANTAEMQRGEPGDTRAFDARTGKKLWVFHTVPRPGEVGHETWLNDGWKGRSGTNVWIWYMTLDAKTGTLYMPVGGPSANYDGTDRPGANMFGNSVVAIDAETGKYKWHFQTIHHDLWDTDLPAPPVLLDIDVDGKKVPALAETGKAAFMYILDRHTGKPVFGVKEKPVAAGDVPGEWYSPTQPIPVKPERLSRSVWTPEDIVTPADTNEAHVAACHALLDSYGGTFFNAGPFTPFFLHEAGGPVKASINMPMNGGSNWGGSAADPTTGYIYVNTSEGGSIGFIEKRKAGADYGRGTQGSTQTYDRASLSGPGAYSSFSASYKDADGKTVTLPCIRPPWGRLIAVNANTGEIAWQTRLGVTDALPEGKQNTGRLNTFGGPIVTAGGLVFIGATDDRRFRAFDSKTGKELWSTELQYSAQAVPITYRGKDGRQYVAVMAANFGAGVRGPDGKPLNQESLVTFALPR